MARKSGLVKLIERLLDDNYQDYEGTHLTHNDYAVIEKYRSRELKKAFRAGIECERQRVIGADKDRGGFELSCAEARDKAKRLAAKYGVRVSS